MFQNAKIGKSLIQSLTLKGETEIRNIKNEERAYIKINIEFLHLLKSS
jgi:hypothetical protein